MCLTVSIGFSQVKNTYQLEIVSLEYDIPNTTIDFQVIEVVDIYGNGEYVEIESFDNFQIMDIYNEDGIIEETYYLDLVDVWDINY